MTLPNLVIAGAPKCGTTSLFEWLVDHPEVCGASVKETKYLLDRGWYSFDRRANVHDHGLAGYEAYFRHCDVRRTRVVLEATPGYLYQETAPRALAGLSPRPRIVFILRNPSERVYSAYQWARHTLPDLHHRASFPEYVARLESTTGDDNLNDAIERGRYVDYLERWVEFFDRSGIEILLFERLREDKRGFMRDVATRIGIEPSFYDRYGFPYKNATQEVRGLRLHRTMLRLGGRIAPQFVRQPSRGAEGLASRVLRRGLGAAYAALNVKGATPPKTADDRRVLAELDRHFAPYNARLARLLDVDLSAWTQPADTPMGSGAPHPSTLERSHEADPGRAA